MPNIVIFVKTRVLITINTNQVKDIKHNTITPPLDFSIVVTVSTIPREGHKVGGNGGKTCENLDQSDWLNPGCHDEFCQRCQLTLSGRYLKEILYLL